MTAITIPELTAQEKALQERDSFLRDVWRHGEVVADQDGSPEVITQEPRRYPLRTHLQWLGMGAFLVSFISFIRK